MLTRAPIDTARAPRIGAEARRETGGPHFFGYLRSITSAIARSRGCTMTIRNALITQSGDD